MRLTEALCRVGRKVRWRIDKGGLRPMVETLGNTMLDPRESKRDGECVTQSH